MWRQKSKGVGQSQELQWEFHVDAAKAGSCGWVTLDHGLVPGEPGKCSGWHLMGNSAPWLGVQVDVGSAERLPGGWRTCGWQGSLVEVTKPWRLVGNPAESRLSQCYVHRVSLQLHYGIEPVGDADSPNTYIPINVNPLAG